MNLTMRIGALLGALSIAASAQAGTGMALEIGTTGLGAHVSVPIQPTLNVRFGVNYAKYSTTRHTDDANYDLDLRMKTVDALVDYFPGGGGGGFRVSGGAVYNGNQFDTNAKPTGIGIYTLNKNIYAAAITGTIDGSVDFRKVAPYLGIGWGNAAAASGWGFVADLGVLFQGAPNSTLGNRGCTASSAICAQLANDLVVENLKLKEDMKNFKFYPVLRVGVSHSF
ncbi:MAG: hypothetical protein M3R60_01905 [Pseudomonadota bacterium]|nr:hypothetical protein [Pseudomonadota bacterium]